MRAEVLDNVKVYCPFSGVVIDGVLTERHFMIGSRCANRSIYIRCPEHIVNAFINHPHIVERYLNDAPKKEAQIRRAPVPGADGKPDGA